MMPRQRLLGLNLHWEDLLQSSLEVFKGYLHLHM